MSSTLRWTTAGGLIAVSLLATTPEAVVARATPPTVSAAEPRATTSRTAIRAGSQATARRGPSRSSARPVLQRWWGTEIVVGSRTVRRLAKVISMGAGAAGVVAVLAAAGIISGPAAIPGGVAAAILTLGRAALALCNWQNRGVRILIPRVAPVATCLPR